MSDILVNIPAVFGQVVTNVATKLNRQIFYDYGKLKEIVRRLIAKGGGKTTKEKYPLVWLVFNYGEDYGDTDEYCKLEDITIMICELSDDKMSTPERIAAKFIPTLYPIYQAFINELGDSGLFDHTGEIDFKHRKIDCPFWNEDMKAGDNNQFADFIDAIQIRGLKLTVNQATCEQFRLIAA